MDDKNCKNFIMQAKCISRCVDLMLENILLSLIVTVSLDFVKNIMGLEFHAG